MEKSRIQSRFFPAFRHLGCIVDLSYEAFNEFRSFTKDSRLQRAESEFKQAEYLFKELKSTDNKLRENFIYSDDLLGTLLKSTMYNRLLVGKLKKPMTKGDLKIDIEKFPSILPVLSIVQREATK